MNILTINVQILKKFEEELHSEQQQLDFLKNIKIDDEFIENEMKKKKSQLKSKTFQEQKIYIASTISIIQEYALILKQPQKRNLEPNLRKENLVNQFLTIAKEIVRKKNWNDIQFPSLNNQNSQICSSCSNSDPNKFETDEFGKKTCLDCALEIKTIEIGHTHLDYSRVNIVGKFVYNRVSHFVDCIKQFQGKQNCKIPEQVYKDLDQKFKAYRLLVDSENFHARYSKITKQHILMFLKELKYVKHYENVNVIYFTLTNKRIDDIGALEYKLIEDFKELVVLYDSLYSKDKAEELNRKNFMNVQYLLFQLLRRHGYDCKIEDFSILKTTDRKQFHDKICSNLFEKLGWNFTPTF